MNYLFILAFAWIAASIIWWTLKNGISPMPSSKKAQRAILEAISPDQTGTLYELGSGWGTLLIPLAKAHKQCTIIGFETSRVPYIVSKMLILILGLKNVHLFQKDFYTESLKDGTAVICYLYPKAMNKLKVKFEQELTTGTKVISNTFAIPEWKPEQILTIQDLYSTKIYIYKVDKNKQNMGYSQF